MSAHADTAAIPQTTDKLQVLSALVLQRALRQRPLELMVLELQQTPMALLRRLVADRRLIDAVRLLAHSLPGREAVWWGCMCVLATLPRDTEHQADAEFAMLRVAEAWVREPDSEALRVRAVQASQMCAGAPVSWLGLAIEWNRRLGRPGAGFGQGVEAAVTRAAARLKPDANGHLLRCTASGAEIASGGVGRITAGPKQTSP